MIVNSAKEIRSLDLGLVQPGQVGRFWLHIINDKIGEPIRLPILIARGRHDGPTFGLTAAVHGNELNGIPIIQKLIRESDLDELHGTIVGVLVVNVPGLLDEQRQFNDGFDLNHRFPGQPDGNLSAVFAHRIVDRILGHLDYLVDLHTASFGRVNSYYVRADMSCEETSRMARLQNPQIIVDNPASDHTLRGTAESMGIRAITLELQDPHLFQHDVIEGGLIGLRNVLCDLDMISGEILCPVKQTILCSGSGWTFTDCGGILEVFPEVATIVEEGQALAEVRSIFGEALATYRAKEKGVVIGRSVNPLNQTGSRIVHLGKNPVEIPCLVD